MNLGSFANAFNGAQVGVQNQRNRQQQILEQQKKKQDQEALQQLVGGIFSNNQITNNSLSQIGDSITQVSSPEITDPFQIETEIQQQTISAKQKLSQALASNLIDIKTAEFLNDQLDTQSKVELRSRLGGNIGGILDSIGTNIFTGRGDLSKAKAIAREARRRNPKLRAFIPDPESEEFETQVSDRSASIGVNEKLIDSYRSVSEKDQVDDNALENKRLLQNEKAQIDLTQESLRQRGTKLTAESAEKVALLNNENVTNNDEARKEVAKAIGKNFGTVYQTTQEAAELANKSDSTLAKLEALAPNAFIGAGGEIKETAARAIKASTGIQIDGLSETEAFRALSSGLVLDELSNFKGAISDRDLEIATNATVNTTQNAEGVSKIITIKRKLNERARDIAELQRSYIDQNGTLDNQWFQSKQRYINDNPLFDDNSVLTDSNTPPNIQSLIDKYAK